MQYNLMKYDENNNIIIKYDPIAMDLKVTVDKRPELIGNPVDILFHDDGYNNVYHMTGSWDNTDSNLGTLCKLLFKNFNSNQDIRMYVQIRPLPKNMSISEVDEIYNKHEEVIVR